MYIIEAACTGNNSRSKMTEAIGNEKVADSGLEDKLIFISSGTRADPKHDLDIPYEKAESILSRASRHGLMNPINIDRARYETDSAYMDTIQREVRMALRIMRPIEASLRTAALHY